jgi:hypothetical protein
LAAAATSNGFGSSERITFGAVPSASWKFESACNESQATGDKLATAMTKRTGNLKISLPEFETRVPPRVAAAAEIQELKSIAKVSLPLRHVLRPQPCAVTGEELTERGSGQFFSGRYLTCS